jgi:hypothetical protein
MTPLDELKFWHQIMGDARRTIVCAPDLESRIKCGLETRGLAGLVTVQVSRNLPDERQVFIVDEQAIAAATNQAIARMGRQSRRYLL